jgi:hypothetical protein
MPVWRPMGNSLHESAVRFSGYGFPAFYSVFTVDRFRDLETNSVQLDTIQKAAATVGKRLIVTFEDLPRSAAYLPNAD